jgi:hypothetical protein
VAQREIDQDDTCPICCDDLLPAGSSSLIVPGAGGSSASSDDDFNANNSLVFCKYSCGKSLHKKCFDMWQKHQNLSNHTALKCVSCRELWGSN